MALTAEWLSRRLGYGFSLNEELPSADIWISRAKDEVGSVPIFDPWRFVAKKPDAKKLSERELPIEITTIESWDLKVDDLRYPDNLTRSVQHFLKMDSERERLRKLRTQNKISEDELQRLWWKKFNTFSWWRDTLTRGLEITHGTTPVFNRFWHFWINHFAVSTESCEGELFGNYYLTLRKNLTKRFEDLLYDAIWHPAMQEFLQNSQSVGPNSQVAKWNREAGGNGPKSINENLGRELLELYTVTPKSNYTQKDVNGATFILTGWGAYFDRGSNEHYFRAERHEPGSHSVMGRLYDNENLEGRLRDLCRDLARHPMTAKHIALKLCRHFISDVPPEDSVAAIEAIFKKSGGALVDVHRAVIDEVVKNGTSTQKFLSPELWFWQLHRTTHSRIPIGYYGQGPDFGLTQINSVLYELGELNSRTPQPNGWPDVETEWLTPEYLDRRIRYANLIASKINDSDSFDPKRYAERLAPEDDDFIKSIKRAETYELAFDLLFCSNKFLRS